MLIGFLILLVCQLVGELVVVALALPVPGPVVGMLFLLMMLLWKGAVFSGLRQVSEGLLSYLALLYVPAGVGLMTHFGLIAEDGLVIAVALVVSTLIAFLVTALCLRWLGKSRLDRLQEGE